MPSQFTKYRVDGKTQLTPELWNGIFRDVDGRVLSLETKQADVDAVIDELIQIGLSRINDVLAPAFAEIEELAHLGDLLRATSATSLAIGAGAKTFIVADGERNRFAAPLFVIAADAAAPDRWVAGQVTAWDADTGALVVNVTNTRGSGTVSDWIISVASIPPEVPPAQSADNVNVTPAGGIAATDVQAALEELDADLTALEATVATKVTQAEVDAAIDALLAGAPGALDTLNELAAALGDDANFAATVTTALAGKVPTTRTISAFGLATGGGDLSADRTITVPIASQTEAQAGTDNTKAMTPLRTAQAISALAAGPDLSTYAQFTTSSDANLQNYPIGTVVIAHSNANHLINSSQTVRIESGARGFNVGGSGTILSGTWRSKGAYDGTAYIFQRVA